MAIVKVKGNFMQKKKSIGELKFSKGSEFKLFSKYIMLRHREGVQKNFFPVHQITILNNKKESRPCFKVKVINDSVILSPALI